MNIRPIANTPSDLAELASLCSALAAHDGHRAAERTPVELAAQIFSGNAKIGCYFAEENGAVAGFILFYESFSTYQLQRGIFIPGLFVKPDFRGKGIGKNLLRAAARYVRENKLGYISLLTAGNNQAAQDFYAKLGGRLDGPWQYCRIENLDF